MRVVEAVGESGSPVSNEHPKDPGKHPFPSTWALSRMKQVEKKLGMERVEFPQCIWGSPAEKQTCISCTLEGSQELDHYGDGKCRCAMHMKLGGKDEKGQFRTRVTQSYPPGLCQKLAELYIRTWMSGKGCHELMNIEEWREQQEIKEIEEELEEPSLGEKVPCPEVAGCWDELERWTETARWTWDLEEHNNVLEARAAAISAKLASADSADWERRHLIISDSQVVIGVLSKGRSSKVQLNRLARKIAAISIATGCKFYWRYVRTHRNHADGPSRGFPLGVAPKEEEKKWWELPDFFYKTTKG